MSASAFRRQRRLSAKADLQSLAQDRGIGARLFAFLSRETAGSKVRIVAASLASGLSRGALLATFNGAAAAGVTGRIDLGLVASFVAALSVYLATNFDSGRQTARVMRGMSQRLRLRICRQLMSAQLRFVEMQGPGRIFTQLAYDIDQVANAGSTFLTSFRSSVVLICALLYLGWLSRPGLLAALLTISVGASAYLWQNRRAKLVLREARGKEDIFHDAVYDLLHGFKELKLNRAQQADLLAHLKSVSDEIRLLAVRASELHLRGTMSSDTFTFGLIAILVFVLPVYFPSSSISIFQFLATVLFITGPAEQLVSSIPVFTRAKIAFSKIEQLERDLTASLAATGEREQDTVPMTFEKIAFKGVQYRFDGANPEDRFDLGPIDFVLNRGETLFICGGNGAGKTTLLKLLTGLYHPTSGKLSVDGKDLAPSDYQRYREMFGVVFSDFYLFRRLYGLQEPDADFVDELLTMLQIGEKTQLKDGAFTTINLSSGQRKRLAYAVSRLNDRQVYVFDEFAADQDPGFRRYFYSELLPELKRQGKTVVAVTHDERWFEAGDRLVKLDYGMIATSGTVAGQPGTA